jgi:hypothetical protein
MFRPDLPVGATYVEQGVKYINSYVPYHPVRKKGDPSRIINHIKRMLPNGNDAEILITFMAAVAQYPWLKFMWAPVIIGAEGNGKSWLASLLEYVIGYQYTHKPNARDLINKFNGWVPGTLLAIVDEINTNGDSSVMDALKVLIASDRIDIQKKGVDSETGWNFSKFMFMGNHLDGIPISEDSRRFCILVCNQMTAEDVRRDFPEANYFPDLIRWTNEEGMAIFADYLLDYDLDARFNPAGTCVRAPVTTSTHRVVKESMDHFQQYVLNAIDEERPGFAGGWVSSNALGSLIKSVRLRDEITPRQYRKKLKALGYVPHPALPGGRVNTNITQEGDNKPVIYVKEGSVMAMNLHTPADVKAAYVKAQRYGDDLPRQNPGVFGNGR